MIHDSLFKACQLPIQEILAERPGRDDELFLAAMDYIIEGIRAGRRNQQEFPQHLARALELIPNYSRRVEPLPVTWLHPGEEENK